MKSLVEKTVGARRLLAGRAVVVDRYDVELPDGRRSIREVVRHRGAVVVLGISVVNPGKFLLIRQYRKAVEQTLIEAVAGCIESGEDPDVAALRELKEETGFSVVALHKLGITYPCPGYCEEVQYLYYAELQASPSDQAFDEDEYVEPFLMTADEINRGIADGTITDAKTIVLWHKYCALRK